MKKMMKIIDIEIFQNICEYNGKEEIVKNRFMRKIFICNNEKLTSQIFYKNS